MGRIEAERNRIRNWVETRLRDGDPEPPPKKSFKSKFNLPVLKSYRGSTDDRYWQYWPKLSWKDSRNLKSQINPDKLWEMAIDTGFQDKSLLKQVCEDLRKGADIGCRDEYRVQSASTNAPSAFEDGEKVSDAICEWLAQGYAIGPLDKDEIPFDWVKINGLMTRPKPNGKVRIILNLSKGDPCCVNDGIDKSDFPTVMGSVKRFVRMLISCGEGAEFTKLDWAAAYKHIRVRPEDVQLQFFKWLDKYFAELALVFGSVSSAGIYDRAAKIVLFIAIQLSGLPPHMVCQYLDDVVGASPAGSGLTYRFDQTYQQVCQAVGVELASRDDPDKSFGPSTHGVVLGVHFDTVKWIWALPADKLGYIISMLKEALEADQLEQRFLKSLYGKLEHIRELVPDSKFHIGQIVKASSVTADLSAMINVWDWCKEELNWWYTYLPVYSGRAPIPDPDYSLPLSALQGFTDAAGGSLVSRGNGIGAFLPPHTWAYVAYGFRINGPGVDEKGKKLCRKMSAWELAGPLLLLCSMPEELFGKLLIIWVDNSGSVFVYSKGYSTACSLCCTLINAIHEVARAIGCEVEIRKIRRCSDKGSTAADNLSKADFRSFKRLIPAANKQPELVPEAFLSWMEDPKQDRFLGKRIVKQMEKYYKLIR